MRDVPFMLPRTSSSVAINVDSDSNNEAPFVGDGDGAPEAQHVHLDQANMPGGGNQRRCHPFDLKLAAAAIEEGGGEEEEEEEEEEDDFDDDFDSDFYDDVDDDEAEAQMVGPARLPPIPTPVVKGLRVTRRTASSIAINIPEAGPEISVGPDDEDFKGLVKDRRLDCFRLLGGSEGIAAKLASSTLGGIRGDDPDLQGRRELFGVNTYPKRKTKSLCSHFWDAMRDVFLLMLLVCAALSLGFGIKEHGVKDGWYEGVGMFVSVFLIAAMSAVGSHCHAKLFDQPIRDSESDNNPVTVIRGGQKQDVLSSDVVVGDVVLLKVNDVMPADGVVIFEEDLEVRKSMTLTPVFLGEERRPFCPAGARVTRGYGRILVTAVGKDTNCGEWMSRRTITIRNTEQTPLQMRLDGLRSKISNVRNALATLTAIYSSGDTGDKTTKVFAVSAFQHTLAVVVSAIPEALPLAVSLTLAFCTKRMLEERVLVQQLSNCETLGSVTTFCTSIGGLLAPDQMTVTELWVDTTPVEEVVNIASDVVDLLCQGIWYTRGFTIEQSALWSWAVTTLGMDSDHMNMTYKISDLTCDDGVFIEERARDKTLCHWNGPADELLARCCRYVSADGEEYELGVEKRSKFKKIVSDMSEANLCSLALVFKQVNTKEDTWDRICAKKDLTLLCLVGLKAPCRPEVKDAIEACATAGVSVKMVTGCKTATAQVIAKECGIISRNDSTVLNVIEAYMFEDMPRDRQLEKVDRIRVLSCSRRSGMRLLVHRLRERGHVVASICDGTHEPSDDPDYDIPFFFEVIQPDVIMDNNSLDTVVRAAGWARCVYTNIQKFIQFQLTFNIAALVVNLVSAVTKGKVLLTSVQLLWVSLAIDIMGALSLAADRPHLKELMRRPPISRTAPLISNAMWRDITAQAMFQVAVLLWIAYGGGHFFGKSVNAMTFNAFVLCQVFNEFNARQFEQKNIFAGLRRNKMFLAIVAATLALQVLMVEVLAKFVGTQRLSWVQWGVCGVIAVMSWPIALVVKFIPVPDKPFHEILPKFRFGFVSR